MQNENLITRSASLLGEHSSGSGSAAPGWNVLSEPDLGSPFEPPASLAPSTSLDGPALNWSVLNWSHRRSPRRRWTTLSHPLRLHMARAQRCAQRGDGSDVHEQRKLAQTGRRLAMAAQLYGVNLSAAGSCAVYRLSIARVNSLVPDWQLTLQPRNESC